MKSPHQMTDGELAYARNDLTEVIRLQDQSVRLAQAYNASISAESICPKLSEYRDDLCAVYEEINQRKKKEQDSPEKVLRDVCNVLRGKQLSEELAACIPWDRMRKFMAKE